MITAKMMVLGAALAGTAGMGGLGAGVWRAHAGFGGHGGHSPEMFHKFIQFAVNEKLDQVAATDEQRAKVREVSERLLKEAQALHQGKQDLHEQMLELMAQDEPDPARVKALVRDRMQEFARFADDATDGLLELHRTFTPEQRAKLLADARARHAH
jgi:Spy/CpxP family protein refolding chaperone